MFHSYLIFQPAWDIWTYWNQAYKKDIVNDGFSMHWVSAGSQRKKKWMKIFTSMWRFKTLRNVEWNVMWRDDKRHRQWRWRAISKFKEKKTRVRLQIKYRLFSLYVCLWAFHSSFLRVSERFCAFLSVPVLFSFSFFWISVSFLRVSSRNDSILSARFFQTQDRMIHFSFRFQN